MVKWISAVAECVTAVGVILAFLQLRLAQITVEKDHERSRREGAVQYLYAWTKSINRQLACARRLVDRLEFEACQQIAGRQQAHIRKSLSQDLSSCFPAGTKLGEIDGDFVLTPEQSAEVRALAITYLNTLETILCAWWVSSVDRDVIEKEFAFQLSPSDGRTLMKDFRSIIGNENYPAIAAFEAHLNKATQHKEYGGKRPIH
ncbi:MAG: hypothetical protein ACYCO5_08695 [Acidobacteriaceae bacterium]